MKKSELQQLIKEEISRMLKEDREAILSNEILNFLEERGIIDPSDAQKVHKDLTSFLKSKNIQLHEYGDSGDFDGTGLMVVGRTTLDNNAIQDMLDETDYYGVWNGKEGYWFFKEEEENFDALEIELEKEFAQRGINARFEAQF